MHLIPKILHQIWIGPNQMPNKINDYRKTFKENFSDYEYMFWNNDNIPDMPQKCKNQFKRYGEKKKYAFQADILRYYIMNLYGGIYADVDFMCNKNFSHLIKKSFFCVSPNQKGFHVCNGIFACLPNNPILTKLINELKNEPYHGPILFTKYISEYIGINFKSNIFNYLEKNPHEYIQCGKPKDFFHKNGYCFHDALRSWLPKKIEE